MTLKAPMAVPDSMRRSRWKRIVFSREAALVPVLILLLIVGSLLNSVFLTPANLLNVLQQSAVLSVVVVAESMVLIVGRFDLSLESIVGFGPALAALLTVSATTGGIGLDLPPLLGLLVLFAVGGFVGFLNGFFVVKLGLNAFMVTLAMLIILRGLLLGVTNGATIFGLPPEFTYLGSGRIAGIPVSILVAILVAVVVGLVLRYHRFGRAMYAIGGNINAARAAGVRVERTIWTVYVIAGLLSALAGLILVGRIASVTANMGQNLIFTVMAAAVVGGVALTGGVGGIFGAMTGVLMLGVTQNILTLSAVSSFWIDAVFGAIILAALALGRFTGRKEPS